MDCSEKVRPSRPGPLMPMNSEAIAGKSTPLAVPSRKSTAAGGTAGIAASAKKQSAMPSSAAPIRGIGGRRFRNSMLKVTSAPRLSSDSRMPVDRMPPFPLVAWESGSSKKSTPWAQATKKGSRKYRNENDCRAPGASASSAIAG
ncbi:hypothetical protein D3C71_1656660 [compost metagenome]